MRVQPAFGRVHRAGLAAVAAALSLGLLGLAAPQALAAAPVCNDASYTVEAGVDLTVPIQGPCTDADGDTLTGQAVTFPTHGSLGPGPNGGGIYRASTTFTGTDSFTYRASDGTQTSNVATATIHVTPSTGGNNAAPTCFPTSLHEFGGNGVNFTPQCFDPDTPTGNLSITLVDAPQHGSFNGPLVVGQTVRYIADPPYPGSDSFTFTASDGLHDSAPVTVPIQISVFPAGNLPPTCPVMHVFVSPGGSVPIKGNCVDPDGDPFFYSLAPPSVTRGSLSLVPPDTAIYTPFPSTPVGAVDTLGYSATDPYHDPVLFVASISVTSAGETQFDTAPAATPSEPYAASVTLPAALSSGGFVKVDAREVTETAPDGYYFFEHEFDIKAPDATDVADPLSFVFKLDASEVADLGLPVNQIGVFRNTVPVPDCLVQGAGRADPTPCIEKRELRPDGDLWITALTMQASVWNFGARVGPPDADGDGVADATDNCVHVANANQLDQDADGVGAACDSKEIPTGKDDCKGDGWRAFNGKYRFSNQGDCVSFVATGGKNKPKG